MHMCIEAIIKDCYKVILHKLELLKAKSEKQSFKTRGSLDLNETNRANINTVHMDITEPMIA